MRCCTLIGIVGLLLICTGITIAQPLRTGLVVYPPFGEQDGTGICPEIWSEIAEIAGLTYALKPRANVQNTLEAVVAGELDLAIGPISITAQRLETITFALPYFRASVGLLVPAETETLWDRLKPFFRVAVLSSIGALLIVLFIVGNLMWLAERKENPNQFPPDYLPGIGNGMWFSLVTLTTVGYGDRAPVTTKGRIVAGTWMVISMVVVSSLIAGLASAFTISLSNMASEQFTTLEDIKGRRVAVVTGTTSAQWASNHKARSVETGSIDEAVALLAAGKAEAVVFGKPLLRYYLKQHPEQPFKLADLSLATEDYGFAVPINSPHQHAINRALKQIEESGRVQNIIDSWLD